MQKQPPHSHRRVAPLLFLFFPTSLVALLLLLLLACNGLLCLTTVLPPSSAPPLTSRRRHSIMETLPRSPVMAVREEVPLPDPVTHQRSELFEETSNGLSPPQPPPPPQLIAASSPSRSGGKKLKLKLKKKTRAYLRTLHPNARSRRFAARAEEFFTVPPSSSRNSTGPRRCETRFFMTWISSLESFGRREAFTIESLFRAHPDACLLILSNSMDTPAGARLLRPFADKGFRLSAMCPDYTHLLRSTPADSWFQRLLKGGINPGDVPLGQNLSNLLRLAVLYKFGGVYLDTDVWILKSFSGLRNAIGAQTVDAETGRWSRLNNAVMVFDRHHPLLYKFIEEFSLTFDGSKWGHNGPYLVSRVVGRVVGRKGYDNFTILPPEAFYPVRWSGVGGLFRGPRDDGHSKWLSAKLRGIREKSFAVHLWNRQSKNMVIEEGSIVGQIMSDRCVFCNFSSASE